MTSSVEIAAPPRATAFGLDVWAERRLTFLHAGRTGASGRRLELDTLGAAARRWPAEATLISDQRDPEGAVVFQIERSAVGYRIAGPDYGEAIIAVDGGAVAGALGVGGWPAWQRLLVAQVLPFAAVLRGLEALHASAVAIDGEAVAFVGRSGAGKTSVAAALSRRGAAFLADDVLALERRGERLLGHSGPPLAGLARPEFERLRRSGELVGGTILAEDAREAIVRMRPPPEPAPLGAIFLLDRRAEGPAEPSFEPVLDPRELLSATFNQVLLDGVRLESLLDVCARAAAGRVERITCGPATDASELAARVARRIGAEL